MAGARHAPDRDADTGDHGGTTEGVFVSEWQCDVLYGRNEAVGGHYILAHAQPPEPARTDHAASPRRMMLWHANYHPDGGQLFFPVDGRPFYVPLALPGNDVTPQRFVCFRFDDRQGLYIHPDVWHKGVFCLAGTQRFFDKQGAMHARVSVDFARGFDCLLQVAVVPSATSVGLLASASSGLRTVELGTGNEANLQRFFDANPQYFMSVNGEPAGPKKWLVGHLDGEGALQAIVNVLSDLLTPSVWHISLLIVAAARHGNARAARFWEPMGFVEVRRREGEIMGRLTNTLRAMIKPLAGDSLDDYLALALVPRDRSQA